MTDEQRKSFEEAARPLILTWRGDNGCKPATDAECALWDALRDQEALLRHVVAAHTGENADGCAISNADIDRITAHLGATHNTAPTVVDI